MRIRAAGISAATHMPVCHCHWLETIRYLGTTFNDLLQRLQDAQAERQFVSTMRA